MDDAARVAEINPIDQLEHDEADLLLGDGVLVLGEVFLEVVFGEFKDQMQLLLAGSVDHVHQAVSQRGYLTILGCGFNSFKMEISRMAVEGTP